MLLLARGLLRFCSVCVALYRICLALQLLTGILLRFSSVVWFCAGFAQFLLLFKALFVWLCIGLGFQKETQKNTKAN